MKFIRLIFFSAVIFFSLACIVSIFIPSHIRVFRMIHLASSKDSVLSKVRDLSQWKYWYPGFQDLELKNIRSDGGSVTQATTRSNVMLTILESDSNRVKVEMKKGDRPVIAGWQIDRSTNGDSLVLQGYIEFNLRWYPWEKFSSLMLDKSYGEVLLQGLQNLKSDAR